MADGSGRIFRGTNQHNRTSCVQIRNILGLFLPLRPLTAETFGRATLVVLQGEVGVVGGLRSQAVEEVPSAPRLVGVHRRHRLDELQWARERDSGQSVGRGIFFSLECRGPKVKKERRWRGVKTIRGQKSPSSESFAATFSPSNVAAPRSLVPVQLWCSHTGTPPGSASARAGCR